MSAPRWTPGPWRLEQDGIGRRVVRAATRMRVVTLDANTLDGDAQVIAAAAEMREAIAAAAEFLRNGTPIHAGSDVANDLLAALAKAGGQP